MNKSILLAASMLLVLVAQPGACQTSTAPQLWAHTLPGQSSPSMFGYGSPPVGRGPAFQYSTSATDQAVMQGLVTMTQPFLRRSQESRGNAVDAYPPPFTNDDSSQEAFGAHPGVSVPMDAGPDIPSHPAPARPSGGVFMP